MQADHVTYGQFFDRDLSWLSFNARVLDEAAKQTVPLFERARFLSIYSSNLDEFYRVRMPILQALKEISDKDDSGKSSQAASAKQADEVVQKQLSRFGQILKEIITELKKKKIQLHYNEALDGSSKSEITNYFYSQVLAFLRPVFLSKRSFFLKIMSCTLLLIFRMSKKTSSLRF
jgi:polyphosphate kinase